MQVSNTYIASCLPEIPTAVSVTIILYFDQDTYTYLLLYAPVSAPVSARLRRRLCGRIAVASHRRRIESLQSPGDFIGITIASGATDSLHAD